MLAGRPAGFPRFPLLLAIAMFVDIFGATDRIAVKGVGVAAGLPIFIGVREAAYIRLTDRLDRVTDEPRISLATHLLA